MSTDQLPSTPLDEVAATLRDRASADAGMGHSPAAMLAEARAVEFPLEVYGREFTVLAWLHDDDRDRLNSDSLSTVLYPSDVDLTSIDEQVRRTDYLSVKHLRERDLSETDIWEDTAHLLATAVGYHTRAILDGRSHGWRRSSHDEPQVEEAIEVTR